MLNKYLDLIEKHPKRLAGTIATITGLCFLVYIPVQISTSKTDQPRIEEQAETSVNEPTDYVDDEPFDRTQCKVYYAGVVLGANVFRFRYSSSSIYLMFTDSDRLVDKHQNRGASIWQTKADFLNLLGYDLMQQMEPKVKEVFASRLDSASYVAVVDDSLTTKAIGSANSCVR